MSDFCDRDGPHQTCHCMELRKQVSEMAAKHLTVESQLQDRLAKVENRAEWYKDALERIRDFDHDESSPDCVPAAPVYECCCRKDDQWGIARDALKGNSGMCGASKEVAHGTACCQFDPAHDGPHKFGTWEWEDE